ncbi:MAG: hypothetical protein QNK31_00940 [Porticoccus sp.]|nr:hypothetical protein [Porticoccus sp.]
MKRLIAHNRSVIASLLVGWLLLCGMMPLMAMDMSMDMSMNDMVASHGSHHSTSAFDMFGEPQSSTADQHCCDALADSVLVVQHQFVDFLFGLSLIVSICSFFFLWAITTGKISPYYYSFIPPSGPPLHQRICVWLD